MAEVGKTVRVVNRDEREKIYKNAFVDTETEGWFDIYRPSESQSGRAEKIAGYRMSEIKMWEYVEED